MTLQDETDDAGADLEFTADDARALNRAGDPINKLPPGARLLHEGRRVERADTFAVSRAAHEAARHEADLLQAAEQERRRLKGESGSSGLRDDNPQVIAVDAQIKARRKLFDRAQARATAAAERTQAIAGPTDDAERYLAGLPQGAELSDYRGPEPKLARGETAIDGATRMRAEVDRIQAEIHSVESAPRPAADAIADMRRLIGEAAERGRPRVHYLLEGATEIQWPTALERLAVHGIAKSETMAPVTGFASGQATDALGILCWAMRPAIEKALEAEIRQHADDANALSAPARATKLKDLRDRLLAAERAEAWFVDEAAGAMHQRRGIDPRALLRIVGPEPQE